MIGAHKGRDAREALRIARRIRRCARIQMQRNPATHSGIGQCIRTTTTCVGIIANRRVNQITARAARNTVGQAAARDRVTVIAANDVLEVAKRIRPPTRRRSRRQVNGHRRCRIREVDRIRSASPTIQRIRSRAGIKQIVPRPAQNTVIARRAVNRVAMIGSNKIGNPRETRRVTACIGRRTRIQMQCNCGRIVDKRQRIRAATTNERIKPRTGSIEQIVARTASNAVIPRTASDRVAIGRTNDLREVS